MAEEKTKKIFQLKQYSPLVEIKSQLIQVVIPKNTPASVKVKIELPDVQNLRNSHIMKVEVFHFADFPKCILTGAVVISEAILKSIFLTLQDYSGYNFVLQSPAIVYHTNATVRENQPPVFVGQKVNYPKSYIEIADTTLLSTTVDEVLPIKVYYRLFDKEERAGRAASFRQQS